MSQSQKPELQAAADPEVSDRPRRRKFSAKYKLEILREIETCAEEGKIGAVLRREGLYRSHISTWRQAREAGDLLALTPKKRGRPCKPIDPAKTEVDRLERENAKLKEELRKAHLIIDVQKNSRRS